MTVKELEALTGPKGKPFMLRAYGGSSYLRRARFNDSKVPNERIETALEAIDQHEKELQRLRKLFKSAMQ